MPAVALVGSYELLMVVIRSGQVPSVRMIRARLHVGQSRAQRVRAYLTALINT